MRTQEPERKKRIEKRYMEEARRACSVFPKGELVPHEKPDFLLKTASGTIGIEVTTLCREGPRRTSRRLEKVLERAKGSYTRFGAEPVDVSVAFAPQAENADHRKLTKSLVDFVHAHRKSRGSFRRDLPEGLCHIGIHTPREPTGRWYSGRGFVTAVASKELLESRVAEKNKSVPEYRRSASDVWLLIINDQFLGPGEVQVRSEDLAEWEFSFDFGKVLLFSREPDSNGEVFELRRR